MADKPFDLISETLGAMPVINYFIDLIGLAELLERHVPANDRRLRLDPSVVLGVVVRNLVLHREPVYALGEWAVPFDPSLFSLEPDEVGMLNDDRIARCLTRLFDADRASLLTELMTGVIKTFDIDCSQLHNDSTSVTFSGTYSGAVGVRRGDKDVADLTFGHNKDHRPDLKQLVWILTVAADGAVPLAYRVESGNTDDDSTHIPTWDGLVDLVGRPDFLYVADCKLANRAAMDHISTRGGRFLTVLPRTRKEDATFRSEVGVSPVDWTEIKRKAPKRIGDPDEVYWAYESLVPTSEGYRIIWIRSSQKMALDSTVRSERIKKATNGLVALNAKLSSPRTRSNDKVAVTQAVLGVLRDSGAERWISFSVREEQEHTYRQKTRGRPGADTDHIKTTKVRFGIEWSVDHNAVKADAQSDGCFPLITNDKAMTAAELLDAYKYQPNLERRHAQLKGSQLVAPVFLKDSARIEGLLCCHYFALLIQALVEREIRDAMAAEETSSIPLYPEDRACGAPSAARIFEIFSGVARHHLVRDDEVVQVFDPELTDLQLEVLRLLDISPDVYVSA